MQKEYVVVILHRIPHLRGLVIKARLHLLCSDPLSSLDLSKCALKAVLWIPKTVVAPTVSKPTPKLAPTRGKQPAIKLDAASSSIFVTDGEQLQLFKTM